MVQIPERERLLRQAFAAEDQHLFCYIFLKKRSYFSCPLWSRILLFRRSAKQSLSCTTLASALVRLINSTDAPFLAEDLLSAELYFELAESHFKLTKTDAVYGLKNTHLFDSLSSGLSFKYRLSKSSEMYGCIEEGLHAQHGSPEETEILLVGACIQLLLHGSGIYQELEEPDEVLKKLKAQQMVRVVKDFRALNVLEVQFFKNIHVRSILILLTSSSQSSMPKLAGSRKTNEMMCGLSFSPSIEVISIIHT